MASRRVRVVVLCEDLAHFRFARRCLIECGWRSDQIISNISKGGSGYDHVLDGYPAEVRANRQGLVQRELLVVIDADTQPDGGREEQLAQRLRAAKVTERRSTDRIALWVPRRQIETWVYFLAQGEADEKADYKRKHAVRPEEHVPAAQEFAKALHARRALPRGAPRSIQKAVREFERIRTAPRRSPQTRQR